MRIRLCRCGLWACGILKAGRRGGCPPPQITGGPTKDKIWDPRSARVKKEKRLEPPRSGGATFVRGGFTGARSETFPSLPGSSKKPCTPSVANTSGPTFGSPKENPFVERASRSLQVIFLNYKLDLLFTT